MWRVRPSLVLGGPVQPGSAVLGVFPSPASNGMERGRGVGGSLRACVSLLLAALKGQLNLARFAVEGSGLNLLSF